MILLIDSYDSFVFNLDQALAALGGATRVVRVDAMTPDELRALEPEAVVLSPGPGAPEPGGPLDRLLQGLDPAVPVLGVCLGHQALIVSEGGSLEVDDAPMHGKTSLVHHDSSELFDRMPSPLVVGRYHSLVARHDGIPGTLEVTAWTEDGRVMGVRHRSLPRYGVQFHPESILTPRGGDVLARFVSLAGIPLDAAEAAGSVR
ncbi:MAG: aminodeoxychorismate/anthranilate synthase component II [Planctomycetota bacterium]